MSYISGLLATTRDPWGVGDHASPNTRTAAHGFSRVTWTGEIWNGRNRESL